MSVTRLETTLENDPYYAARVDLAASFRWAARWNMHESVANHFSVLVSTDPCVFLVNPCGSHFSRIRASDLILVDANNPDELLRDDVDPTAWGIHSAIHKAVPHARCLMHLHPRYATALASVKDRSFPAIDQNSMRFFERIQIDDQYDGMGLGNEAERLASALTGRSILLMGNHGVLSMGDSVARALDDMYYFERACQNLVTALSTGRELAVVADDIARKTRQQWEEFLAKGSDVQHLEALKQILDEEEPDYRL
jgi:ribulose-5-phosphate 4-epimerase/fuculose-1-phosphate aldolase